MKRFARIQNNVVIEFIDLQDNEDLSTRLHKDFVDSCVECDLSIRSGDVFNPVSKKFSSPPAPPAPTAQDFALTQIANSDAQILRAIEVLIDVLITKGVIVASDFPAGVRALYQARKAQRAAAGLP